MNLELKPLRELIAIVHTLPNGDLYLQGDWPWTEDTFGIIYIGEKAISLGDVDLEFVEKNYLTHVIESATLEDVILNAHLQKSYVSLSEIVAAFNHYYKHDGFMTLE